MGNIGLIPARVQGVRKVEWQLFFSHADPGETKNLAADTANAEMIERLTLQLNMEWDKAHR